MQCKEPLRKKAAADAKALPLAINGYMLLGDEVAVLHQSFLGACRADVNSGVLLLLDVDHLSARGEGS